MGIKDFLRDYEPSVSLNNATLPIQQTMVAVELRMISKIILSKKQTTSGTATPLILIGKYVYKWSLKLFLRQVTGGCAAYLRGLSWYARFSQVSSHDLYLEAPENFENPFCCTQKVRFDQMSHECQMNLE